MSCCNVLLLTVKMILKAIVALCAFLIYLSNNNNIKSSLSSVYRGAYTTSFVYMNFSCGQGCCCIHVILHSKRFITEIQSD